MIIKQFFSASALVAGYVVEHTYALDHEGNVFLATFQGTGAPLSKEYGLMDRPRMLLQPVEQVYEDGKQPVSDPVPVCKPSEAPVSMKSLCYLCNGRGGKYGRACEKCGE